jgi:hypothetical protein
MANKWVTHDFSNYPPGGPLSSAYLADADEFNQNYQDVCDAVGARYVRGVSCADKNSTSTTCEIWLEADGGARDVCDAGWYALIYYGASNVWETTVSVSGSDCYVVFGDSQLENPATSGVSDYSSAPFIDALHIVLFPKKMMLPKDWLITTSGANGALSTAEIYHEGEALSAFIADVKDRVDVALDGTGNLNAGVVDSTAINGADAVKFDSPVNLLAGGSLEHYGDQHDLLFKVEAIGGGTYAITEAAEETDGSARAQKVTAAGSNEGIALSLNPDFADKILAGKDVAATFRVKADVADSLEIGFLEDSTYSGTTPDITADTWTTVTVSKEISSGTEQVRAYIRSTTGPVTFFVARAQMNLGDKCFGFSIGPYEDAARILMDTTQDNLLYNGGFERWTLTDGTDAPDGWYAINGAEFSLDDGSAVAPGTGNKVCVATLEANDGIGQYLGLLTDVGTGALVNENILVGLVRGSKVCASVDLVMDQTTSAPVTLVLGDRIDTTSSPEEIEFPVEPLTDGMRRFTIYKDIREGARHVYFKIVNKEAATVHLKIDNAMLHIGEFPLKFKPSAGWREMRWDFSDNDLTDSTSMEAEGITGGGFAMPGYAGGYLMLKAAASCLTSPSADSDVFQLCVDSTSENGLSVTINSSETHTENHVTDYTETVHECGDYMQAPIINALGGGVDATGVVLSVWGYYYAS